MAVPSSGQLGLYADIGTELGVTQSDVSLGTMSNTTGFTDPDAMSEFYGYSNAANVYFYLSANGGTRVYLSEIGIPNGFNVATNLVINYEYFYLDDMEGDYSTTSRSDTFTFNYDFDEISKIVTSYPIYIEYITNIYSWYVASGGTGLNVIGVYD